MAEDCAFVHGDEPLVTKLNNSRDGDGVSILKTYVLTREVKEMTRKKCRSIHSAHPLRREPSSEGSHMRRGGNATTCEGIRAPYPKPHCDGYDA